MFGLLRWLIGSKDIVEYEPEEQRRKRVSANERYHLIARLAAEIEAREAMLATSTPRRWQQKRSTPDTR